LDEYRINKDRQSTPFTFAITSATKVESNIRYRRTGLVLGSYRGLEPRTIRDTAKRPRVSRCPTFFRLPTRYSETPYCGCITVIVVVKTGETSSQIAVVVVVVVIVVVVVVAVVVVLVHAGELPVVVVVVDVVMLVVVVVVNVLVVNVFPVPPATILISVGLSSRRVETRT